MGDEGKVIGGTCGEDIRAEPSPDIEGHVALSIDDHGCYAMALLPVANARALAARILAAAEMAEPPRHG